MVRKTHIEVSSYYHIINRGVEQRVVFKKKDDYEHFEKLMCFYTKSYEKKYTESKSIQERILSAYDC